MGPHEIFLDIHLPPEDQMTQFRQTPRQATCGAKTEIPSGETVTPCHLTKGHEGPHEGWCLGSRCLWEDNTVYDWGNHEWTEELE